MSPARFSRPAFAELPSGTRFYFVRHGESEANRRRVIQGRQDVPLSSAGLAHARAAAEWLSSQRIDAVYTSPLTRAKDTAKVIAEVSGLAEAVSLPELIEIDTGIFSGLSFADIEIRFPTEWEAFRRHSWEVVPEAERIAALRVRAFEVWESLIGAARSGRRRIASVTHAGMLQWIIRASLGSDGEAWMPVFKTANCGIFLLSAEPVPATAEQPASFYAEWELMNFVPYET